MEANGESPSLDFPRGEAKYQSQPWREDKNYNNKRVRKKKSFSLMT